MTTTESPTAKAMREASERRLAATPNFVPNARPARRDIIRYRAPRISRKAIR